MNIDEGTTVTCNITFYHAKSFNFTWALRNKNISGNVADMNPDRNLATYSSILDYTFQSEDNMSWLTCTFSASYEYGYYENTTSTRLNLQCELGKFVPHNRLFIAYHYGIFICKRKIYGFSTPPLYSNNVRVVEA